ncbi:hypothetical protein NXV73_09890 [Bacteroides salyersiae]|nr:hypothetical protein [Bacteroides salyersiae]
MRQILTCLILIGLLCTGDLYATDNGKKETIRRLRQEFARHISGTPVTNYTLAESLSLIDADGRFTDKRPEEEIIIRNNYAAGTNMAHCIQINNLTRDCFERLQVIANSYRGVKGLDPSDKGVQTLLRGIAFYGKMENERNNDAPGRFHASCFATPRAAVKTYFALLDLMDRIEAGEVKDSIALAAHQKLFDVGFQSWTQPYRHDETDKNVVSVERFRKHVWWVGGNALDYRPVLGSSRDDEFHPDDRCIVRSSDRFVIRSFANHLRRRFLDRRNYRRRCRMGTWNAMPCMGISHRRAKRNFPHIETPARLTVGQATFAGKCRSGASLYPLFRFLSPQRHHPTVGRQRKHDAEKQPPWQCAFTHPCQNIAGRLAYITHFRRNTRNRNNSPKSLPT